MGLSRLRKFICRWILRLLAWICPAELNPRLEVLLLRDQLERLIKRNLELEHRLAADSARIGIDAVAATLIRSLSSAEQAMSAEAVNDRRYTIPEVHATLRGFLTTEDNGFVLRPVGPEQMVSPDSLGTLQMTVIQVPTTPLPDAQRALSDALGRAQAVFNAGGPERGAVVAQEIVAEASHLLAIQQQYEEEEFVQAAHRMAQSAVRLGEALRQQIPSESFRDYIASAERLHELTQSLVQARRAKPEDLARLATRVTDLTQNYIKIIQSSDG